MTDTQRHHHAPDEGQVSLFEKGILPSDKWKKARFSSQGRMQRDNQVPAAFSSLTAQELGFPPVLDPHIPAEPQGILPATPGMHRSSLTLIPDQPASPCKSLACSVQSTPGRKAPVRVGEFRGTQNTRIYTSSLTAPLPLVLPTGWDFNDPFPP